MTRFRALLLDFGGVCLRLPFEIHREVEATLGLPSPTFTWQGPIDLDSDPLWREIVEGRSTEREYWKVRAAEVGRAIGRELSIADYMRICCNRPEEQFIRPEAVAVVNEARARGLRIGILTNDLAAFLGPTWKEGVRFLREMDAFTDMSHQKKMKPKPEAYAAALANLGADVKETLFVDDQPVNVAGARRFGLAAIHFEVGRPAESWAAVRRRLFAG